MKLVSFSADLNNINIAIESDRLKTTTSTIDALSHLFDDMNETGFYDLYDCLSSINEVTSDKIISGTIYHAKDGTKYFISMEAISELIDEQSNQFVTSFGSFSSLIESFIAEEFGSLTREVMGDRLEHNFTEIKPS
ncbi:TPA: hypothetical protein ACPVZG_004183 [Vibrio parahaemolyticus]|uniref:Uncharacterized protein n=1 Tax=Vibrio parahaemolyticus TaxID=670 RepID=A0AAW8PYK8_VIBPH|nr:hypothetical protein [Vibrio parahaemolyticus]MDS1821094.1 hypothetical protein [Vibrio parahaemolyticus]